MAYASWSVVFGEQPSAAKWNILGTNDASFNNGTGLPSGTCVQIAYTNYSAAATGTGVIPLDDTIPQNTEGDQYMTQSITPRSATNLLSISISAYLTNSIAPHTMVIALFQDSTASAIAVGTHVVTAAGYRETQNLQYTMVAGTTSSTTFKMRAGGNGGGTVTFNGSTGAREYGAVTKSSIIIREYTV